MSRHTTLPALVLLVACACTARPSHGVEPPPTPADAAPALRSADNPLAVLPVGATRLTVIAPDVVELLRVTGDPPPGAPRAWDLVDGKGYLRLPAASELSVTAGGQPIAVTALGFRRRALYAPLTRRDLRLGNWLYLKLAHPVPEGAAVTVAHGAGALGPAARFDTIAERLRLGPAIHVNQVGYQPEHPKKAMVGYYLGSLGELPIAEGTPFQLVETSTEKSVFQGTLRRRPDRGSPLRVAPYGDVWEADFSALRTPGEYRLAVAGLGASFAFRVDPGTDAAFARTYALGLYHQRCGAANELPYTRFTHPPCHLAPALVPIGDFPHTDKFLGDMSQPDRTQEAPHLSSVAAALYPYARRGSVDVHGGHHDAGDYGKYTLNSSQLIHYLVFAADALPGVVQLDNLGLPESGDGKSDLLQIAAWEADFLARMQDADGGFYFLVRPRDRSYESNVLPERGDPQVVFPKNTTATAAAVAALAQIGSSPHFKKQFPALARRYVEQAKKGWEFLERAWAARSRRGAWQRVSRGNELFRDDDQVAWAATEMFLATGDPRARRRLLEEFDPASAKTRRWGWWRLYAGYGAAARSYAVAARSGRVPASQLDAAHLAKCERELEAAADDGVAYSEAMAYGASYPLETKRFKTAGWFFPVERAFDIEVARRLARDPGHARARLEAVVANINYEAGTNPNDVTFLTGLGWKRQREVVHQYAQNDHRVLPPSGIPLGSLQDGFAALGPYKNQLRELCFPPDSDPVNPYPLYDRWGDSFNVATEFVAALQARSLAVLASLMADTKSGSRPYRHLTARIVGVPAQASTSATVEAHLEVSHRPLAEARVVWEAEGQEPTFGPTFRFRPAHPGRQWIEAEAQWPDGERAFAVHQFDAAGSP